MRIARLIVIGGLLVVVSSAAEAGGRGSDAKLPKPIDVLSISRPWDPSRTRPSLREHKYNKPGWGAQWKQLFHTTPYRAQPYIRGY